MPAAVADKKGEYLERTIYSTFSGGKQLAGFQVKRDFIGAGRNLWDKRDYVQYFYRQTNWRYTDSGGNWNDVSCSRIFESWNSRSWRWLDTGCAGNAFEYRNLCSDALYGSVFCGRMVRCSSCSVWKEQKNRDNNLHHAADAIVIANLTPAYLEIASDKIKLDRIYKDYHKRISDEYLT